MSARDLLSHPFTLLVVLGVIVWLASSSIRRNDPSLSIWIGFGYLLKVAGSMANFQVTQATYGGLQDVELYDSAARVIVDDIAGGQLWPDVPAFYSLGPSTDNVSRALAWWYLLIDEDVVTAYLASAAIGYLGVLAFIRAAQIALPSARTMPYVVLLVGVPSLVYFPSIVGKDAPALLFLGLVALGVARISAGQRPVAGAIVVSFGLLGMVIVRPHIAAVVIIALGGALLLTPSPRASSLLRSVTGIGILVAFYGVFRQQFASTDPEQLVDFFISTIGNTTIDRTSFQNRAAESPLQFILSLLSVLSRPWPNEASNLALVVASIEGLCLAVYLTAVVLRGRRTISGLVDNLYARFCLLTVVGLTFLLVVLSNFGLLVRQRVQVWPFLFIVVLLAGTRPADDDGGSELASRDSELASRDIEHASRDIGQSGVGERLAAVAAQPATNGHAEQIGPRP